MSTPNPTPSAEATPKRPTIAELEAIMESNKGEVIDIATDGQISVRNYKAEYEALRAENERKSHTLAQVEKALNGESSDALDPLARMVSSLRKRVAELEKTNQVHCEDWAHDHTEVQAICRKAGFAEPQVEGDSYGVPGVIDLAELLASRITALESELKGAWAMKEAWENAHKELNKNASDKLTALQATVQALEGDKTLLDAIDAMYPEDTKETCRDLLRSALATYPEGKKTP